MYLFFHQQLVTGVHNYFQVNPFTSIHWPKSVCGAMALGPFVTSPQSILTEHASDGLDR